MNKTYIIVIILVVLVGAVAASGLLRVPKSTEAPLPGAPGSEAVACTMEAKLCPDGSYVGRIGPNCEFAACPSPATSATPEVKEFIVSGKNFSFTPSLITVKKGDRVKIIFQNSEGFHDFVLDGYGVATKQAKAPSTEILEFTADRAGSFEYYCSVGTHKAMGMKGILRVE